MDADEVRAEARRLLHVQRASNPLDGAEPYWEFRDFVVDHADVLLADPAPVGLTEVRMDMAGDALMAAWAIIANAWEGDWSQAPNEWRAAAERWRDEDFHPLLDALNAQEADHHG